MLKEPSQEKFLKKPKTNNKKIKTKLKIENKLQTKARVISDSAKPQGETQPASFYSFVHPL